MIAHQLGQLLSTDLLWKNLVKVLKPQESGSGSVLVLVGALGRQRTLQAVRLQGGCRIKWSTLKWDLASLSM